MPHPAPTVSDIATADAAVATLTGWINDGDTATAAAQAAADAAQAAADAAQTAADAAQTAADAAQAAADAADTSLTTMGTLVNEWAKTLVSRNNQFPPEPPV